MADIKPGDVVRYIPQSKHAHDNPWWCRDGWAIAVERDGAVILYDTYWVSDRTALSPEELATATVQWNLNNVRPPAYPGEWDRMHPDDRYRIDSRNHASMLYIRIGAEPHHGTQVQNQRRKVAEAKAAVRDAHWRLEAARRVLREVENRG